MADKVGSVYIEASVDTTGVIQAGKAIGVTADKIEKDLAGVGAAAATVNTNMTKTASAVQAANGSMNSLRGSAGQVGFQLQDIAVQAQAGTSAFVILGQQGSQLASSFGPGGAVLGAVIAIASAIGGVLYTSLKNASGAMKELPEEMQKQLEEIKKRYSEIDEASQTAFTQVELGKINTQYEKQKKVVDGLKSSIKLYSDEIANGNQAAGHNVLALTIRLRSAQKELENIANLQTRVGQELAGANVTGKLEDGLKDSTNAAEQLAAQLQTAVLKITDGELAARRYAAAQTLGLKAGEQLPQQIDDLIVKHYQLEEALKLNNEQRKDALELQRESRAELDRELQAELSILDAKNKAAADAKKKIESDFGRVQSGITSDLESPAQAAERELKERLEVIRKYHGLETEEAARRTQTGVEAETAYQKRLTEIKKQEDENRKNQNMDMARSAADTFGILADIAKEGGKKSFDQWKIFASAQAAISAALAITNALTLPPPFGFIAAGAIGAATAVQIAKINSTQYAGGGRLYGGPVQAGGMYPVTEDGRPEILKQGNRQYLLPGSRGGEVVSNRDMQPTGGGGGIVINYNPTIYAQDSDFEAIMAGQPEAVLNAVRMGLASEGRTL